MRPLFRKTLNSLTGRLTILFIVVHLATVIGLSIYQNKQFVKQVEGEGFPPLALVYRLEEIRKDYPSLDLTQKTQTPLKASVELKDWNDILEKNPELWFYLESHGDEIQYGRSPVLLSDVLEVRDQQRASKPSCENMSSSGTHAGYEVIAGFASCQTDETAYEVGGLEPDYTPPSKYNSFVTFREELRLWPALISYLGLILLMPVLIYGLVSPIRRASLAALSISPYSKRKLLPVEGMLSEVKGLGDATNKALKKLNAGYVRERWLRDVIAHELRTPLMVLRGHIEDVVDINTRQELAEGLKRANRVLERLMEFSTATSLATSAPQSLKLVQVVRAACAETGAFATRNKTDFNFVAPSHNDTRVTANKVAVMLILTNILNNAIRHSDSERPIDVEVFDHGEIQIRDYGKGMDIAELNKFFHKFATLDERLMQRKGLGFIIIAELMEFCDGEIDAFETKGGGVGFSLRLPIASTLNTAQDKLRY